MRGSSFGARNRLNTVPVPVNRTNRPTTHRVLTSFNAGKMVPLAVIPLLREDQLRASQFEFSFEMQETVEILMNAVNIRVMAYLVPKLALERYDGIDAINKSYEGIAPYDGGTIVPWFEPMVGEDYGDNPILTSMGKHWKPGANHNAEYIEMYNAIWNMRAKNRSPDIALRTRLDTSLAPAFWLHQTFAHIVPDFDQALIEGEVPLSVANGKLPVKGIGLAATPGNKNASQGIRESGTGGVATTYASGGWNVDDFDDALAAGKGRLALKADPANAGFPDIWAELQNNGITLSLANIELARKTAAFARLRTQYNAHDEYIINLLMDGITIPEQEWKNPILLFDDVTQVGMSKRYATDAANLTESVVNGMTRMQMRLATPRVPMGGAIMILCEVTPEQLFERQKDPYLHALTVNDVPEFMEDELDPEKVVVVRNDEIDLDHDQPTATFGYAPLNHEWMRNQPCIGGRFYRPAVDASFDEDRQRIWAVETQNPVLSADFYLCTTMHYKPFVITDAGFDHFDCLMRGEGIIGGNTVFGGALIEASVDYDKVMEQAPLDPIDKPDP